MGRALARQKATFTPLVITQLATLEEDLGGRAELVGLLTLAPLTPDLAYILGLLGDPTHARRSLAEICATGNVLPGMLLQQIEHAAHLRGRVKAAQVVSRTLHTVVEDVMKKAAPYHAPCSQCMGTGSLTPDPTPQLPNPSPGPCDLCRGTGQLLYQPQLRHQELALEMGRVLPKGAGLVINNTANAAARAEGGSMGGGSLEQLQRLTDKILYDEEAAEGEILPGDPHGDST